MKQLLLLLGVSQSLFASPYRCLFSPENEPNKSIAHDTSLSSDHLLYELQDEFDSLLRVELRTDWRSYFNINVAEEETPSEKMDSVSYKQNPLERDSFKGVLYVGDSRPRLEYQCTKTSDND